MATAYTREITTTLGSDLNNRDDVRSPDLNKIEKQLKNYGDLIDNNNEAINQIKSRQNQIILHIEDSDEEEFKSQDDLSDHYCD